MCSIQDKIYLYEKTKEQNIYLINQYQIQLSNFTKHIRTVIQNIYSNKTNKTTLNHKVINLMSLYRTEVDFCNTIIQELQNQNIYLHSLIHRLSSNSY